MFFGHNHAIEHILPMSAVWALSTVFVALETANLSIGWRV